MEIEKMSATELWEYAESLRDNGDYENAAKYMKKAARMGEILAQDSLAQYYEKGIVYRGILRKSIATTFRNLAQIL